jgi:lipopolysaccharide/colanic/teichoic acid biosynthesis glycosyltransferase
MIRKFQLLMKRGIDILISFVGLAMLSVFLLAMVLAVKLNLKGPVFFRHARPGKNGKIFYLYKFRTMKDLRDADGNLLPDEERLTKFGKFLRRLSLDELPELWNVLKGDMSLVGPRPLVVQYLDRYTPEQARRHEVTPGITGWAQINGRNALTWEKKFEYDVWYVDNWSLLLDIKVIVVTIWKVLKGEGISQPGFATAEEFMGSDAISKSAQDKTGEKIL